mmetsp:Transcript_18017/g.51598  ORF Transcript_18017/g.51598 Transcript_18017/m.51598 type:complete len:163 (+) Transcript_18017:330-818(+)
MRLQSRGRSARHSRRPPASVAATRTPPDRKKAKGATTPPSTAQSKEDVFAPSRAFKLAAAVLCGCDHGMWYRLAPDPQKRDDLSVASRHSWENILATFIEAGLFGTRQVDKLGIEHRIEIRSTAWELMTTYLNEGGVRSESSDHLCYAKATTQVLVCDSLEC